MDIGRPVKVSAFPPTSSDSFTTDSSLLPLSRLLDIEYRLCEAVDMSPDRSYSSGAPTLVEWTREPKVSLLGVCGKARDTPVAAFAEGRSVCAASYRDRPSRT